LKEFKNIGNILISIIEILSKLQIIE
jgi:hypothetical protein